jgi:pimeloyl-ACP methyl ester carboxylesterase
LQRPPNAPRYAEVAGAVSDPAMSKSTLTLNIEKPMTILRETSSGGLPTSLTAAISSPLYASGQGIIEYLECGPRTAPAILLLHGLGSNALGYRLQLLQLSDRFRMIAWNAPEQLDSLVGLIDVSIDRKTIADRLIAPDADIAIRRSVESLRDAVTPRGWKQAAHTLFSVYVPDIIGHVRCPIFIVAGSLDKVAPIACHALRLKDAAPKAQLRVIEGAGHIIKLEAPQELNTIITMVAANEV